MPPPRLVLFDLYRGCEIAIRALGGRYLALEAGKPTGCNPLQQEPTPARIQFWEHLVRTCIATPALPLLPADERAIADAVKAVALMQRALRRFSTVRQNLPKAGDNSLHERLGRWCQGGALGWVFDEAEDRLGDLGAGLSTSAVVAFDTTEFIELPGVRTPVMLYLLHRMQELVDGERLIYVISEFWKALDHEIFSDFARQQQKTIRKHNGLGIFDTQSPSDVLQHPIGRTMVEQSVTKIFLANTDAVRDEYLDGFGLSDAEFDTVRSLGAQGGRRFLVKQGNTSVVCELDLDARGGHPMLVKQGAHSALCELDLSDSALLDFLPVLSGSTDNVALLDSVRERHGDDPFQWLPVLLREVQDRKTRTSRRAA